MTSSGRAETLAEAVALAYANNPALQAQREQLRAVNETYVQTRAGYGPQLNLNASSSYTRVEGDYFQTNPVGGGAPTGSGVRSGEAGTFGLTLNQTLFTSGRLRAALNATEADILAQRQVLRQAEIQLMQQVIAAYIGVRRDLQLVAVYQDNLEALQRQLRQTRAEFDVRQVTRTDVDLTTGRVALARTTLANARAQLEISRSQYLALVGQNPGELEPEPPLGALPPTIDAAFDLAEANNAPLLAAQYREQAARLRVVQARRNYLPTVQAQVGLVNSPVLGYAPDLGDQDQLVATISVAQPLFTSGLTASGVRQTTAQANQLLAQVEQSRRTAVQTVTQGWSQLAAAREALEADTAGIAATEAAFFGVRREQGFGLRLPVDVLNAVQELNATQVRLLQDRYNEYLAHAAVLAATGVLEASLIAPGLDLYQPEADFRRVRNKGALPIEPVIKALDSVAVPRVTAPTPPRNPTGADRPTRDLPLPAAPPPASQARAFQPTTAVIEAESRDAPSRRQVNPSPTLTPAPGAGTGRVFSAQPLPSPPGSAPAIAPIAPASPVPSGTP